MIQGGAQSTLKEGAPPWQFLPWQLGAMRLLHHPSTDTNLAYEEVLALPTGMKWHIRLWQPYGKVYMPMCGLMHACMHAC